MSSAEQILFSDARHYFDAEPGDRLLHYCSLAAAEGIAESNSIWLSEYDKTNDRTEFTFAKLRFAEKIRSLKSEFSPRAISEYESRLREFEENMSMLIHSKCGRFATMGALCGQLSGLRLGI